MPYCGKCGAQVTEDMNFCQICSSPLKMPISLAAIKAPESYPNGTRQYPLEILLGLMWVFLAFLNISTNDARNHFSTYSIVAIISLSIATSFLITYPATKWQLRILEKKSEIRSSVRTLLIAIGGVIIFAAVFIYFIPAYPPPAFYLLTNFIYPIFPATLLMRATLYANWERKHGKRIYGSTLKLFVFPKD